MEGRVAFSPSLTFVLHGVLLPVGPRHVKAQGADWQGLSGADKMDWKSGFPPLSSSDKQITSAFINGGRGTTIASLAAPLSGSRGNFFFLSSNKFPEQISFSVQAYNNI